MCLYLLFFNFCSKHYILSFNSVSNLSLGSHRWKLFRELPSVERINRQRQDYFQNEILLLQDQSGLVLSQFIDWLQICSQMIVTIVCLWCPARAGLWFVSSKAKTVQQFNGHVSFYFKQSLAGIVVLIFCSFAYLVHCQAHSRDLTLV